MRVISLVPSWTETLIEAGVEVVGSTRFCVHTGDQKPLRVGGTKDVDWGKATKLNPDLVIFDQEENTREMYESCPFPKISTQVLDLNTCAKELERLSDLLKNNLLRSFAQRIRQVLKKGLAKQTLDPRRTPGVLRWIREPSETPRLVLYAIWNEPFMVASANTYIGSVMKTLGVGPLLESTERYPKLALRDLDKSQTLILLSSEPYPFERKADEIASHHFPCALIDGESYSWFGIRSLRFLEGL